MTDSFHIPEVLSGLGTPLRIYPPRAGAGRAGYFTISVVLALLAGLALIGIVNPPEHNPPPPEALIAVLCVLGGLALTFVCMGLYSRSYTLVLFPDALARLGGGVSEVFRWSDVREIYTYLHPFAGKQRIVAQDGRKLEIDVNVKDGKELVQTVQQTLFDRMLPAATKAFDAGQTLTFGTLRLDRSFLYYKDKRIAWDQIAKMQFLYNAYTRSIQFEVRTAGTLLLPWCVVRAQDIPNVDVFKKLVERKRAFAL